MGVRLVFGLPREGKREMTNKKFLIKHNHEIHHELEQTLGSVLYKRLNAVRRRKDKAFDQAVTFLAEEVNASAFAEFDKDFGYNKPVSLPPDEPEGLLERLRVCANTQGNETKALAALSLAFTVIRCRTQRRLLNDRQ
jgi:hypothetical protein